MYTSEESQMQTNNQILVKEKKLNILSKLWYEVQPRNRDVNLKLSIFSILGLFRTFQLKIKIAKNWVN